MTTTSSRPEIRLSDYTNWIIDPIRDRVTTAARDYADRPVAPGASQEQLAEMAKPWAAIAAVATAAAAGRVAMATTGHQAEVALAVAVAAFAAAVVLGMAAGRRITDRRHRVRVRAFLAAAASWISVAMVTGVSSEMLYILAVLGVGMSLWHWREHGLGYGPWEALQTPVKDRVDVFGPRWEQNLAAGGRILSGTKLTEWEPLEFGARYALIVVPGTHTIDEIESLLPRIRSGLRLKQSHKIQLDEHPELEAPALLLTIIDTSPVAAGTRWPGLGAMNDDGTIRIGPYLDGEGGALWKLYSRNRIHNGMIAGGTGSGKSRLLENIAVTAAGNQLFPTAVWFADGQDGASSPMLMRHADFYAGKPEQIVAMLREAVEVIGIQQDENKALGLQGFTPTPDRPGLLVILDECKLVLDKQNNPEHWEETQQLVARIATTGNKAGVGIILAGQEATLPTFGGGGQWPAAIRNNIKGANGVLLKSEEAAGGNIFGIPALTMRQIPSGGGYGYVAGGEGSRKAMMRGFYDDDEQMAANMGAFDWRSVSPVTALDLSIAYRDRRLTADEDLAGARERYENRRRRHANGDTSTKPLAVIPDLVQPRGGSAFTSFTLSSPFVGPAKKITAGQDRVLQAVLDGHSNWQDISKASGLGRDRVYAYLKDLTGMELVRKDKHGQWVAMS